MSLQHSHPRVNLVGQGIVGHGFLRLFGLEIGKNAGNCAKGWATRALVGKRIVGHIPISFGS